MPNPSGKAATPEAEAARRAKISATMKERAKLKARGKGGKFKKAPARIVEVSYRRKGRDKVIGSARGKRLHHRGWDYVSGATEPVFIDTDDINAIRQELERRHPSRAYYEISKPKKVRRAAK